MSKNISRIIKIFLASSIVEFEQERIELGDFILSLNQSIYENRGISLRWNKPENMSSAFSLDGSQSNFDLAIRESDIFFLVAGHKIGKYTKAEFDVAFNRLRETGGKQPKIYTWFYLPNGFSDGSGKDFYNGPRFSDQGSKKEREHGMMKKR